MSSVGVEATGALDDGVDDEDDQDDDAEEEREPEQAEEDQGLGVAVLASPGGDGLVVTSRAVVGDAAHQYTCLYRRTSAMLMMLITSVMRNSSSPTANRAL